METAPATSTTGPPLAIRNFRCHSSQLQAIDAPSACNCSTVQQRLTSVRKTSRDGGRQTRFEVVSPVNELLCPRLLALASKEGHRMLRKSAMRSDNRPERQTVRSPDRSATSATAEPATSLDELPC